MGSTPLKPCPFCPDGGKAHATQENLPVRQTERAECLSCFAEIEGPGSIDRWNTHAQLPSQGGEAVEVVGYMSSEGMDNGLIRRTRYKTYTTPVMTVAQHQRILAASVGSAEPVAWAICKEPGRVDWLSATYANKRAAEEHVASYKNDLTLYITPLYTHPAALSTTNGEEKNHGL